MSRRNVSLVRRLFEVYNERSFAENLDLLDPDIVWDMSRMELPDAASSSGRSELRSFVEAWGEGFASDRVEAQEMFDAGDRVVVMVHHRGQGMSSGIEIDQRFAMVWTLRDGRATRMEMYPTLYEALEAVGLSEHPAPN
jgi:ketosteroid isomerase-like protein